MRKSTAGCGFSLLELAIVLTVIALVTGMGLVAGMGAIESAKRTATQNKLDAIEDALMAFRSSKNRLPCPSDITLASTVNTNGVEAANPGICTGGLPAANTVTAAAPFIVEGGVPARTLNLPDEFMYDAWGRKLVYAVNLAATEYRAFTAIKPDENCSVMVTDAGANTRANGIYALLSHGPNGHGGYLSNGTRMNAGSTNVNERSNCHCDFVGLPPAYTGSYIQREATQNPVVSTDVFDDVVRYKERWQMQTYDDGYQYTGYRGPQLAVGFERGVGDPASSVQLFRHQCGLWVPTNNPPATVPTESTSAVAFTANNDYLLAYSKSLCTLYRIAADGTLTAQPNAFTGAACPDYTALGVMPDVALSNNGYLMLTASAAPNVWMRKQTEGSFYGLQLKSALNPPNPVPTISPANPTMVAMSGNADFMALANSASTPVVYRRKGDTFVPLVTQPAGMSGADIRAIAFSPDNRYFVIATMVGLITRIDVWSIRNNTFTPFAAPTWVAVDEPKALAFSPDGQYLVLGGGAAWGGDNITIIKIDEGNVFTSLLLPSGWVNDANLAGTSFAFTPDSIYIAMTTINDGFGGVMPVAIFRQTSPTTYRFVSEAVQTPLAFTALSVAVYH